jgi:hypothetical protein
MLYANIPQLIERGRFLLVGSSLLLLLVAILSPRLGVLLFSHNHLLSGIVLTLAFVALLPAKVFILALPLGISVLFAIRWISAQKIAAVGLPLTYLDLLNTVSDPRAFFYALGLPGYDVASRLLPWLAMAAVSGALLLACRSVSPRWAIYRVAEGGVIIAAGLLALNAVSTHMRDRLPQLYPDIESDLWQPSGQQRLAHAAGPLEYIAFTRLLGDKDAASVRVDEVPALPTSAIEAAFVQIVGRHFPKSAELPNIVYIHAESTFDPNEIFVLAEAISLPLWSGFPDTRALAPLRVNVVGGGSWVTEFEILTGVDARNFGYHGFYTHQMVGPRVNHAFPAYLSKKGYETAAYYSEKADYFGVGRAFSRYGFQRFEDAQSLGIAADWSDSDLIIMQRIIAHGAFAARESPFFYFLSTSQNHGPHPCRNFKEPEQLVVRFAAEASFAHNCALNEYVHRARTTSEALEAVLEQLRQLERETGRPYVVLLYGDHQPWSFTDGSYSIAGGISRDGRMLSFAQFRQASNENLTFLHLLSSIEGTFDPIAEQPVPVTMVPTLVSAYVASGWDDLYFPANLLAYRECGSDFRASGCPLANDMDSWGKLAILRDP